MRSVSWSTNLVKVVRESFDGFVFFTVEKKRRNIGRFNDDGLVSILFFLALMTQHLCLTSLKQYVTEAGHLPHSPRNGGNDDRAAARPPGKGLSVYLSRDPYIRMEAGSMQRHHPTLPLFLYQFFGSVTKSRSVSGGVVVRGEIPE